RRGTDLDPLEARLRATPAGGRDPGAVRAEGAAAGGDEAGEGRPGPGGEALRGPQRAAFLRLAAGVFVLWADAGAGAGGARGGGGGSDSDRQDRPGGVTSGHDPRRLGPEQAEQPDPRLGQRRERQERDRAVVPPGGADRLRRGGRGVGGQLG